MDWVGLWIHGDFRKVKIFRLEKLIPACGSIRNAIQRCCKWPCRDISQVVALGDSRDRRAVKIAAEENYAGNFLLSNVLEDLRPLPGITIPSVAAAARHRHRRRNKFKDRSRP